MDMSVQVESEDQEEIVVNTPSKRRTRAMRIVDDDDESAGEEEEEEADEEEEDADGVRLLSLTRPDLRLFIPVRDSRRRTNWSPNRNLRFQFPLRRR
jgi:hypothetical protein